MAASPIYVAFKRTNCTLVQLFIRLPSSRALVSKMRACLSGRRKNLPYNFATVYPGEGKEKVAAHAFVSRVRRKGLLLQVRWFEAEEGPPSEFGRLSDLLRCIPEDFAEREAFVWAVFSYDKEKVTSLFKPISLLDQPTIFDEITGITGVKRSPEGKMVYELELSLGGNRVNHVVRFTQNVKFSEELPLALLEAGSRISLLGLKPKEGQ